MNWQKNTQGDAGEYALGLAGGAVDVAGKTIKSKNAPEGAERIIPPETEPEQAKPMEETCAEGDLTIPGTQNVRNAQIDRPETSETAIPGANGRLTEKGSKPNHKGH